MTEANAYLDEGYARYYDWTWHAYRADIPFYTGLAEEHGWSVLEVACGTGRVTIPLARAGCHVAGIDLSPAMLDLARQKLAAEPPEVQERVQLTQADMEQFDLSRQFDCVFAPLAAVFHLLGRIPLTHCMRSLFAHTGPGGVAVVDAVSPERMQEQEIGQDVLVGEGINPATGLMTREYKRTLGVSWDTQTVRVEHIFLEGEDDARRRVSFVQSYRWLEREEGAQLLRHAGYPEVQTLGDYDGAQYDEESPRLIFVAHRLDRDVF